MTDLEKKELWHRVGAEVKREGGNLHHAPMAQLVEHRAVMREVVSSTPAGPTLRVLKITE